MLIEATEPAAYVVKRPDPLTVLVELRNVSVGIAAANVVVERRDPITSVTLEQGTGDDGQAVAPRPRGRSRADGVRRAQRAEHDPVATLTAAASRTSRRIRRRLCRRPSRESVDFARGSLRPLQQPRLNACAPGTRQRRRRSRSAETAG